jgi:hypothetical protein
MDLGHTEAIRRQISNLVIMFLRVPYGASHNSFQRRKKRFDMLQTYQEVRTGRHRVSARDFFFEIVFDGLKCMYVCMYVIANFHSANYLIIYKVLQKECQVAQNVGICMTFQNWTLCK